MANVKVAVRVRPLSKREEENDAVSVVNVHNETLLSITNWKIGGTDEGDRHRERVKYFSFDYVFNSSDKWDENYASQERVYQQLGPEVISAACDGYNTCLFAYGQTSSGKTHTMVGTQVDPGLIPRISEGLFRSVTHLNEDVTYKFEISFLEIYNEKVRDLLASPENAKFALKVREHAKDGPYVPDLSRHIVSDYQQVVELLEQGMVSRTTASTHMHEFSSRSHAIFTIHFVQAKMEQQLPSEIVSKINLVDLAGSERANLNFSKDRLQEGANINKSLVMLGNCISALAENALSAISMESLANDDTDLRSSQGFGSRSAGFVPYRNSVLTWLLKDSLGGNAKTIMIATISPASIHYNETMSTLRYARRATHIVNQPIINEDPHVRLIRELKGEIHRLKSLLCSASLGSSSASLCQDYSINQMLQENEVRVDQLTEAWVDKWKDVAQIMQECNVGIRRQSVGVVVESDLPHLIGLDDDLGTGIVLYHLQNGCTRIGRDDALTTQDIVLNSSVDVEREHAVITNEDDVVTFYPLGDAACTINGVDVREPVQLKQGAVILLGKTNMFRFNHPAQAARMREKRAIDKHGVPQAFQHDSVALAAAGEGGTSPVGSSGDGSHSPDDTEAVMEQMSLLLSPRSPHDLKEGHFFESNEFDSFGEQEVVNSEQCIMGDNQQEMVERQRMVVCGLKKEHALAMVKAEEELEEMQRKVEEEKDKGALKLQQEIENYRLHIQTVTSSNGLSEVSMLAKFVDLEFLQVKQADLECKQLMQRELILRHSERKAVANLGRKRAAIDVQRMSTELEIEEEEKRLHEMEMLVSYTPPNERLSSLSSDTSSNGVEEKNANSNKKNRSKESAKTVSNGKLKDAPSSRADKKITLSAKHRRSSSLPQKENTQKVLPNRTRSRSASVSSIKSNDSRTSDGKLQSNGNSKSGSDVFSRLYPQNKPKFDYLKKKDSVQYEDMAAKRSSQWERGKLMRREVSPLKGETPPGKSNIEKQKLKHSYQPKPFENGLLVNSKSSRNGPSKHSDLGSSLPRTKCQSNPGLSRTMPGPKKDSNLMKKGNTASTGKGKNKPFVVSRTSSMPDVSCVDFGKSRLKGKMQSTPDLPKKILKKGEKKAAVWQDAKGSPQRLKPELTRLRSSSDVSTLSSTSSFPKVTSGRRRCSVDLWTSVDLLPIQKSSSQAYFLPWNSEKCVSLENLSSDMMPQSMAGPPRSSSMFDLGSNALDDRNEGIAISEGEFEREERQSGIVVMKAVEPKEEMRESLPPSEFPLDCDRDGDEEKKGEASSETSSSSDISDADSLEEEFRERDKLDGELNLLKEDNGTKEEKDSQIILENGEKSLPFEQSPQSFPQVDDEFSPDDRCERQNDVLIKGKEDEENIDGDRTSVPLKPVPVSGSNPGRIQTESKFETCPVSTTEEHESDTESSGDDFSSCDESIASNATYSLPASESLLNKETDGKDLSSNRSTPVIIAKEGMPESREGNPAVDEDRGVEDGEMEVVDDDSDSAIGHCGVERKNALREAGCQTCPVDSVSLHDSNGQESSNDDSSSFGDSTSPDAASSLPKLGLLMEENDLENFGQNSCMPVLLSESGDELPKTYCETGCQTSPVDDENRSNDFEHSDSKDILLSLDQSISPSSGLKNVKMVSFPDKSESKEEGAIVDEVLMKRNEKLLMTETSCQTHPQEVLVQNGTHGAQSSHGDPSSLNGTDVCLVAMEAGTWDKVTPTESLAYHKPDTVSCHPTFNGRERTVTEVGCQTCPLDCVSLNGMGETEPSDVKTVLSPRDWQSCIPDAKEGIKNDEMVLHENEKLSASREISCQTLSVESICLNGLDDVEPSKVLNQEQDNSNGVDLQNDKNAVEPVISFSESSTDEEEEEDEMEKERIKNGINQSDYDGIVPPKVIVITKDNIVNGGDFETNICIDTGNFQGDGEIIGKSGDTVKAFPTQQQTFLETPENITKDLSQNGNLVSQSDEDGDTSSPSPCSSSDLSSSLTDQYPSDGDDKDPYLSTSPLNVSDALPELYLTNTDEGEMYQEEDGDPLQNGASCLEEKSLPVFASEDYSKSPDVILEREDGKELIFKMDGSDEDLDTSPNDSSSSENELNHLYSILDSPDDKEQDEEEVIVEKPEGKEESGDQSEGDDDGDISEESLHSLTYSPEEELDVFRETSEGSKEMVNPLSLISVPVGNENAVLKPSELQLESVPTEAEEEEDKEKENYALDYLLNPDIEGAMQGDRKRSKVVTFGSPLVSICDDVTSQSETLSESDELEGRGFEDGDQQEGDGYGGVKGDDSYLQDNSKDNPFQENSEENPDETVVDGWESSVLSMEQEDWEICDETETKGETRETSVGVELDVTMGSDPCRDEDNSMMEDDGNVMQEEDVGGLSPEKPDKSGEALPANMRDGLGDDPPGIFGDDADDNTTDGLSPMYGENADGNNAFEEEAVCQKRQRRRKVSVGDQGSTEEYPQMFCSECGNRELEQEGVLLDTKNLDEVHDEDQHALPLLHGDELNESCEEDAMDNLFSGFLKKEHLSHLDGYCTVEPENDSEPSSCAVDLPLFVLSDQSKGHNSLPHRSGRQEREVVDEEPELCMTKDDQDMVKDECDGIAHVEDRGLDGEDLVLEVRNESNSGKGSTADSDGDDDQDAFMKDASFSDYDETDDEAESSGDSDEFDVDSFKRNVMQVGVVFHQGKRYIIDGDEIFDPFALSPITEERDNSETLSSLIAAADDFQLPLSEEEEGDVALYQREKTEMAEDETLEPGFYSDESDEDEMCHEKELPDEEMMDDREEEWCPPRIEVALIKDVFTAEQDLPSDLVKSPDAENFLLYQEDSCDQDVTFGELAPHHFPHLHIGGGGCGFDAMNLTTSPEAPKRDDEFLTPLNVNTSPTRTVKTDPKCGISPAASYRKPLKISFSPQEAPFSMASPCSSPESPQRKFVGGNVSRDSGSDTDVSEGETTPIVKGKGDVRQRRKKPLEHLSRNARRDVVRVSRAKLSKFVKLQENEGVVVGQVYLVEEETQTESELSSVGMVQSCVGHDPKSGWESSEPEEKLDQNRKLAQKMVGKDIHKEACSSDFAANTALNKSLPSRQEPEQTKPMVASYTQTSPKVSPGGGTISTDKGKNIQRPSKLHFRPKKEIPDKNHASGAKRPSSNQSPSSDFRWDLFPSATTFQPPKLKRARSLPTEFDNPLLVSPRKGSVDTPSSDGGGLDVGLNPSSQDEVSGDEALADPFSHLIKSLEHQCQKPINTSDRVRKLFDALQCSTSPERESSSSALVESKINGKGVASDEQKCKTDSEPQNSREMQTGTDEDEDLHRFDSGLMWSPSGNLCARCHQCVHHCAGTEYHGCTWNSSGDVPELPLAGKGKWHQQQNVVRDDLMGIMSPVWEPVHKEAVSTICQEDFFSRVKALTEKSQKEQNPDHKSFEGRKNDTQPEINVMSPFSTNQGDLRDLANKLSTSQSRIKPISGDTEELVPQRVQMPAFSDVSFDSEFAEHEFFSDEEKDVSVNITGRERDGELDEDGERNAEEEEEEAREDSDVDPDLFDDVIEPELTALMSNSTNTPVNQTSEYGVSSETQRKTPSDPQNSKGDIHRSETLGGPGNFATDIPAHRIKDHSNDYVLSVNINIPPFPHRVEQSWNNPSYDANLQCNWSNTPEMGNAPNISRGAEMPDKRGQDDAWMSHLTDANACRGQEGLVNGPKRFPSESTESQLTASSGVFTSSIQTSEAVSSPTKLDESLSPTDSVLAEDEDIISVQNELQDFLVKNLTKSNMEPTFHEDYKRGKTSTPEGVGTQVDSSDLENSWTSTELDSLRSEREQVRRLSNSWDRSDLAVELMEARIMHGIGETDAFLKFLDNDVSLEEWLRAKTDLDMKHDEEKREILALEKSKALKTGQSLKVSSPSAFHSKAWTPKKRKSPSEHLKFLQGLRKDLVSNAPLSFGDTKNEIEALLQEYKELHRNSESEIAQAHKELDGVRGANRVPSAAEKVAQVDVRESKESNSDEDLIDKEIQSLHAASIAMSMSDSPGSDVSSHRRFDFSSVSSDDDRISDDTIRERGKYSRLNGDLSDPLKLVKAPCKKSLKEKLEDAERQVSNERQLRKREEQCRQSLMQSPGEWSESECSVLIGQTFHILLQETASFQGVQQHSVEERWESGGWRVLSEMQGIFIFEKSAMDTCIKRYLGLEIVKAPASCVFNHLRKPNNLQGLFGKCLRKFCVLQRLERGKFILQLTFNTRPYGLHYPREVTCVFLAEQQENTFVVGATSVKQQKLQTQKTVPAIVLHFGFCLDPLYRDGMEHCRVTVLSQIDLQDSLESDLLQTISQKLLSRILGNLKGLVEVGRL